MATRRKPGSARSRAAKKKGASTKRASARAGATGRRKSAKRATASRASATRRAPAKRASKRPATRRARPATPAPRPAAASAGPPSGIGLELHHMDFTTHVLDEVRRFYVEVLGFSRFEWEPEIPYLQIHTAAGASLGFMPPSSGPPEDWRPPREPALYFFVTDVDRAHRDLVAKGVTFDGDPADMPWGHRIATLRDPEGRRVVLAQRLGRDR